MEQGRTSGIGNRIFEAGYSGLERVLDSLVEGGTLDAHDIWRGARQLLGMVREELVWPAFLNAGFGLPADADAIIDDAIETYLARFGTKRQVKAGRR